MRLPLPIWRFQFERVVKKHARRFMDIQGRVLKPFERSWSPRKVGKPCSSLRNFLHLFYDKLAFDVLRKLRA
jgi:hypothetical protein